MRAKSLEVEPTPSPPGDRTCLRFITCGSVDDGKSTLIGRMIYESGNVFDDQLRALEADSRLFGSQAEAIDFALLVDGLQAEREQGITIDVAHRFFATARRRFIVADTPGHEQYTRNMATGASTAELAVLLVDARKGVLVQTRRHSRIVDLMGIRHVVLAVNKMDLVDYDSATFLRIEADYRHFAQALGFAEIVATPVSGLRGDNVGIRSARTGWYAGPTLLEHLERVNVAADAGAPAFRMPVQLVSRARPDFRGYCGLISRGEVRPNDAIRIAPSGATTRVKEIWRGFETVAAAHAGESVVLTTTEEIDIGRGDVVAAADAPLASADQFEARAIWFDDHPMTPGRQYLLKLGAREAVATVTAIKYREDMNSGAHLAAKTLEKNDIARVTLSTGGLVPYEPYAVDRTLGGFILIDRLSFQTVGAGVIEFALRRASNIHWQALDVGAAWRAEQKRQKAQCIWFTGLSGAGKSTIANLLDKRLNAEGRHTYLLDGDNVRHGLNRDLGFTEADRVENIRRVAEVARLMVDAGLITLVSFISPFRAERQMARALFPDGAFHEVFIDTPIEECERRDAKGLYALARRGALKNFTGLDSPYESPAAPEAHVRTMGREPEACADEILKTLGL